MNLETSVAVVQCAPDAYAIPDVLALTDENGVSLPFGFLEQHGELD